MKQEKRTIVEKMIQVDQYNNVQLTQEGCKISSYVLGTIAVGSAVAAGVTMNVEPFLATITSGLMSYVSYRSAQDEKGKIR